MTVTDIKLTDQIFFPVLDKTDNTRQVKSNKEPGREMAAICGLSMAGLFTLLGELGCQHWTLSAKQNSGKLTRHPSVCSYCKSPSLIHVCIFSFPLPENTRGRFNYLA